MVYCLERVIRSTGQETEGGGAKVAQLILGRRLLFFLAKVAAELLQAIPLRHPLRPEIQATRAPEMLQTMPLRHLLRPEIQAKLAPELP